MGYTQCEQKKEEGSGGRVWWRPCQQQARDGVTRSPLVTLTETGDVKVGQKTVSSYRRHPLDGHSE